MPPSHRFRPASDAHSHDVRFASLEDCPVTEEASFLEHRAALEATVLAPAARDELVLELHAGVLRRSI